jgi:hypothetical protein
MATIDQISTPKTNQGLEKGRIPYSRAGGILVTTGQHGETSDGVLGDYARGQRTHLDYPFVRGNFATGMRTIATPAATSDFATGMRTASTPAHTGDFATGLRTEPVSVSLALGHRRLTATCCLPVAGLAKWQRAERRATQRCCRRRLNAARPWSMTSSTSPSSY